jgi:hypothetical protein
MVLVTCKLAYVEGINESDSFDAAEVSAKFKDAAYKADEGYHVYHLLR